MRRNRLVTGRWYRQMAGFPLGLRADDQHRSPNALEVFRPALFVNKLAPMKHEEEYMEKPTSRPLFLTL